MSGLLPKAGTGGSGTVAAGNFTDLTVANNAIIGGNEIVGGTLTVYGAAAVGALTAASFNAATLTATNTTNQVRLGNTGAQFTTLNVPAPVASQTVTIPDVGASSSTVMTAGIQSIGGAKTMTALLTANAGLTVPTGQALTVAGTGTVTIGSGTLSSGGAITTTGAISTTGSGAVTAAGLISANAGLTVATAQTLTLTGSAGMTTNSGTLTVGVGGISLAGAAGTIAIGSAGISGTGPITVTGAITATTIAAGFAFGLNSGTTYAPTLSDANVMVLSSNGSTQTVTIPTNASIAYPVGTQISFCQVGAGKVTLAPAGGVTFSSYNSYLSTAGQNAVITAIKTATNAWLITGNLAT